eukprot:EG_transcript_7305
MSDDELEDEEYGDEELADTESVEDVDVPHHPDDELDLRNDLLEEDMAQAEQAGKAEGGAFIVGRDRNSVECCVWIGFPLSSFPRDHLFACGLDSSKSVAIKLAFTDPPMYGSKCPTVEEKHIFIRQTAKRDFSDLGMSQCEPFGLWWTLEQQLSSHLKAAWVLIGGKLQARLEGRREREKQASRRNVARLLEIHPVKRAVAEQALIQSNNHLDCAMELLLDEKRKKELISAAQSRPPTCEPSENLLMSSLKCVRDGIERCARYCLVCQTPHPLELLKPTVCWRELCNFQLTNMGLGINVESELIKYPQACDLLISMTTGASFSGRHFEPFPTVEAWTNDANGASTKVVFDRTRPREVGEVLQKCPSVANMAEMVKKGQLREELEAIHPLLYKLLRWIMGTNRCHLHFVADSATRVDGVHTEHQFILRSAPPERERRFKQLKDLQDRGSFYAFHGSGLGNWHAILRLGLKNFSGTEKQSHGAVYGSGVYLSVDAGTALFYAGHGHVGQGWQNSQFGAAVKCIALCEVVNHGHKDKQCPGQLHRPKCRHTPNSPHYRVEDEELVLTRYLFIYPARVITSSVLAKDLKIPKNATV